MNRNIAECRKLIAAVLLLPLLLAGCGSQEPIDSTRETAPPVATIPSVDINSLGMGEDKTVYSADDEESVICFYITVRRGDEGSGTNHTFAEVNDVLRFVNNLHVDNAVYARALVQVGDENGPTIGALGYGLTQTNATIRIRGNSSTRMVQKSYKLSLDDGAGAWRGQHDIALNKSPFDETRFRNKIYFDLLRDNPDMASVRTQFAHVYIMDETAGETAFRDYGLYLTTEIPGKRYLMNHGLDRYGYLYKAVDFNFEPSPYLKNFDDPDFDQAKFDTILDCKGRQDNSKLIRLVEMINDASIDINDIIGTYIDRDNYIMWLAYNLLTANIDTTVQNFYLYSPTNSDKWYFIPWDGDNMLPWKAYEMEGVLHDYSFTCHGISNYWGLTLHQRFLKYPENRQALADKVDELHEYINRDTINALAARYNAVVEPYVLNMPDLYYLGKTPEERMTIVNGLGDELETAWQDFHESLTNLMPFFLQPPTMEEDMVCLNWDEAYDFDYADIQYTVTVSLYPDLRDPILQEATDVNFLLVSPEILQEGITYYWFVDAYTESGKHTIALNKVSVNGDAYPGVEILEVG